MGLHVLCTFLIGWMDGFFKINQLFIVIVGVKRNEQKGRRVPRYFSPLVSPVIAVSCYCDTFVIINTPVSIRYYSETPSFILGLSFCAVLPMGFDKWLMACLCHFNIMPNNFPDVQRPLSLPSHPSLSPT